MQPLKLSTLCACLLGLLMLTSACSPAAPTVTPAPEPTSTTAPAPAATTAVSSNAFVFEGVRLTLDPALASRAFGHVVPGKPAADGAPYWEVYPQYVTIEMEGYPLTTTAYRPLIAVYPAEDYRGMSPQAGQVIDQLAQFLAEKPAGASKIPALPLRNSVQSFHSNVQHLAFQNGRGVRFLVMYAQGLKPVNNAEIFYTFQGLTTDGRYAVSVTLPVNAPDLPASADALSKAEFEQLFQDAQYIPNLSARLSALPASSFSPDLDRLDKLVESLQIGQ